MQPLTLTEINIGVVILSVLVIVAAVIVQHKSSKQLQKLAELRDKQRIIKHESTTPNPLLKSRPTLYDHADESQEKTANSLNENAGSSKDSDAGRQDSNFHFKEPTPQDEMVMGFYDEHEQKGH